MVANRTRRELLALVAATTGGVAGCLGSGDGTADAGGGDGENAGETTGDTGEVGEWQTAELEDVTTGETFTVGGIDGPVLLHTFAIWCSTCQQQHAQIRELENRASGAYEAVELNVDPNEDAEAVREHAESNGFDWRFAVSPSAVTESLVEEFGSEITVPPASPVVLVCPDGATHVLDASAVMPAGELASALENRCL